MNRIIKGLLAATVCVIIAGSFFQYRGYVKKQEIRRDALLYFKEEDYSKTIQYLEEALNTPALFSTEINHDMTCYLAESFYQLGEYEKAERIYDNLLREDSKEAKYYELKGRCARESGDKERAVEIFEEGWKKTKKSRFLEDICDIYLEAKEYEKALKFTRRGIKAGGEAQRQFMYQEVIIYEKSQKYNEAYDAVNEYCRQFPDDERARQEQIFLSTRIA